MKVNMRQENYTWIPKLVAPRESQWSLLGKFAVWNALTAKKLNHLMGLRKSAYHPINLALTQYIDPDRFTKLTGASIEQIKESLTINYVPEGWGNNLICTSLRFCPACLTHGYHSAIFQVALISVCPIHGIPLTERCEYCGAEKGITSLENNFNNPYICGGCLSVFCDIMNVGKIVPLTQGEIEKIDKLGLELEALILETRQRKVYWGKGQSMSESVDFTFSCYAQCIEEIHKHTSNLSLKKSVNISRQLDWDLTRVKPLIMLWPTYRAIRRYLWRKVLKNHQKCFHIISLLGAAYEGFSLDGALGCIPIHAYIMWRMYWEGHVNIANLNLDLHQPINWSHSDVMSDEEAMRVFSDDCLASFYKLYEKSQDMDRDGNFRLLTRDEIDGLKEGGMFIKNWAITETSGNNSAQISKIFTWTDCREMKVPRVGGKHIEMLYASRDRIQASLKKTTRKSDLTPITGPV